MTTRERPPRVGGYQWERARPQAFGIYNANYSPSGNPLPRGPKPWTVVGPNLTWKTFRSHAKALAWAFAQVPAPDPTPQDQETVTAGWTPPTDHAAAWQQKWNLTR